MDLAIFCFNHVANLITWPEDELGVGILSVLGVILISDNLTPY